MFFHQHLFKLLTDPLEWTKLVVENLVSIHLNFFVVKYLEKETGSLTYYSVYLGVDRTV